MEVVLASLFQVVKLIRKSVMSKSRHFDKKKFYRKARSASATRFF